MSSKLKARDMVTCTGHIGIHEGADGRTDGRTDVDDVMAIKPNFLTSMGYHIFLTMVLRARSSAISGVPFCRSRSLSLFFRFCSSVIGRPGILQP